MEGNLFAFHRVDNLPLLPHPCHIKGVKNRQVKRENGKKGMSFWWTANYFVPLQPIEYVN